MKHSPIKAAFPASFDRDVRLLILGSLPGEKSLAARQYYANPTNQFWRLIGAVIGEDLSALDYADRLKRLLAAGVGLWDVVKSARRAGSLDTAIHDHQTNDLRGFAAALPSLRAIAFNGGKASAIGRKQLAGGDMPVTLVSLPSSSAAYCSVPFEDKRAQWLTLRTYIGNGLA